MAQDTFAILFLIARPAAGKSEIIDYLKRTDEPTRRARFHVGPFVELDDFPLLWAWFEEDRLLARMGHPRLHTDADEYFRRRYLWDVLNEDDVTTVRGPALGQRLEATLARLWRSYTTGCHNES